MEKQLSDKGIEFKQKLDEFGITLTDFFELDTMWYGELPQSDKVCLLEEEIKNERN